jgi:hypothetical protein
MNSIATTTTDPWISATASQRRDALKVALTESASALARAAEIFSAMEAQRDDVSAIPSHLRKALRAIAARTMLPEVWTKLEGTARHRVMSLPIAQQREILDGRIGESLASHGRVAANHGRGLGGAGLSELRGA